LIRARAASAAAALLLIGLGACDSIVGAGGRQLDSTIVCTDDGCECKGGFGDCDDDVDNGCETDLNDTKNCGECANDCGIGKCDDLACVCEPGFADCDKKVSGCETDLTKSKEHCGSCERDCLGGTCTMSLCDPQIIPNTSAAYGFAVKDGSLYFTSTAEPGLFKEPVDGSGAPEKVGTSNDYGMIVRVSGDKLYWTTYTEVLATPLAGGATETLAKDVQPLYRMTVGGGQVYWDDVDPMVMEHSALMRVPATPGGMPEKVTGLGETKYLHDFIASDEHVYFNDTTLIRRVAHGETTPADFATTPVSATLYAVDGAALFFAGQTSGTFRVSFMGGDPEKIADAAPGYGSLEMDADNVYFLTSVAPNDSAQAVWRGSKKGGAAAVKLALDPAMYSGQPMSVDDKWVYWLSLAGVARVPK
jgi:hypothetical protein